MRKVTKKEFPRSEYLEIHKENVRILDKITSDKDWVVKLAKKHYGDKWMMVVDSHPDKTEHRKGMVKENSIRMKMKKDGLFVRPFIPNNRKPIIQHDLNGNIIGKHPSTEEWVEENNHPSYYVNAVLCSIRGDQETAYGYKWSFDDEAMEEIFQQMEQEHFNKLKENE